MQIAALIPEIEAHSEVIRALLAACDLPTADIDSLTTAKFFGVEDETGLNAVVGLELYGDAALLRSLAVRSNQRGRGTGHALVSVAEERARALGVQELFLLTMSAKDFFAGLGYSVADRANAPDAIKGTRQFSGLCPDSAVFMHKRLA